MEGHLLTLTLIIPSFEKTFFVVVMFLMACDGKVVKARPIGASPGQILCV